MNEQYNLQAATCTAGTAAVSLICSVQLLPACMAAEADCIAIRLHANDAVTEPSVRAWVAGSVAVLAFGACQDCDLGVGVTECVPACTCSEGSTAAHDENVFGLHIQNTIYNTAYARYRCSTYVQLQKGKGQPRTDNGA